MYSHPISKYSSSNLLFKFISLELISGNPQFIAFKNISVVLEKRLFIIKKIIYYILIFIYYIHFNHLIKYRVSQNKVWKSS